MNKENITKYNTEELVRIIENDYDGLYELFIKAVQNNNRSNVIAMVEGKFIYTKEQLKELKKTFIFCKDFI